MKTSSSSPGVVQGDTARAVAGGGRQVSSSGGFLRTSMVKVILRTADGAVKPVRQRWKLVRIHGQEKGSWKEAG